MVQFSAADAERAAAEVLAALAPVTAPATRAALGRYVAALARFGAHTDLVGARTAGSLAEIALADALVLARHPDLLRSPAWEIGAGGASLLVPLALLVPALAGRLLEPRQKRATFLRLAVGQLGLGARLAVEQRRIEPAEAPRGVAGCVLGRAVFGPEVWIPMAAGMLAPGGALVVLTTGEVSVPAGFVTAAVERYALPVAGSARVATWLAPG